MLDLHANATAGCRAALAVAALLSSLWACGEEHSATVPIDEIPSDKRINELDDAEVKGVCEWTTMLAHEKVPPGTNCRGLEIMTGTCMSLPAACQATLAEVQTCFPAVFEDIGADPCVLLEIRTQAELITFIEAHPGCEGFGECGTIGMP